MLEAYIERLKQRETPAKAKGTLREQIETWWRDEHLRQPYYTMASLAKLFKAHPRYIGPILYSIGFKRRRTYPVNRPSVRYWIPPGGKQNGKLSG